VTLLLIISLLKMHILINN